MQPTHIYKGKKYAVIGYGKFKLDKAWYEAVSYKACYELDDIPQNTIFTRTLEDFDSNFEKITNDY